ncbi:hypothetical protein H4219_005586 [Mycoemilia scoparia]|uniref:Uncharacterized protein n=1 Tax=Mycoemilia scoparia TaxID=417184 RepID=A0A9W7ZSK5_9FUNG|nr:hypothetical protein H4219_005586 [Mycoemilia scoparia]
MPIQSNDRNKDSTEGKTIAHYKSSQNIFDDDCNVEREISRLSHERCLDNRSPFPMVSMPTKLSPPVQPPPSLSPCKCFSGDMDQGAFDTIPYNDSSSDSLSSDFPDRTHEGYDDHRARFSAFSPSERHFPIIDYFPFPEQNDNTINDDNGGESDNADSIDAIFRLYNECWEQYEVISLELSRIEAELLQQSQRLLLPIQTPELTADDSCSPNSPLCAQLWVDGEQDHPGCSNSHGLFERSIRTQNLASKTSGEVRVVDKGFSEFNCPDLGNEPGKEPLSRPNRKRRLNFPGCVVDSNDGRSLGAKIKRARSI